MFKLIKNKNKIILKTSLRWKKHCKLVNIIQE